jgi:hypothetical protein
MMKWDKVQDKEVNILPESIREKLLQVKAVLLQQIEDDKRRIDALRQKCKEGGV